MKLRDPKDAPDDTEILGFAKWAWERVDDSGQPSLKVCYFDSDMDMRKTACGDTFDKWNYETGDVIPESFKVYMTETENPYSDYGLLIGWLPMPEYETFT